MAPVHERPHTCPGDVHAQLQRSEDTPHRPNDVEGLAGCLWDEQQAGGGGGPEELTAGLCMGEQGPAEDRQQRGCHGNSP